MKFLYNFSNNCHLFAVVVNGQRLPSSQSSANVLDFSQSLIANLQSNGLRGYVLFVENNGITSIRANIMGLSNKESYDWRVYSPGSPSTDSPCPAMSSSSITLDLTTLLGPLEIGRENIFSAKLKTITGENTLIGRTLVLKGLKSGSVSCALILPFGSKKTFEVKFHSPIEGTVYLIQCNNITGLIASLSYSTQIRKSSTNKWTLMAGLEADATETAKIEHEYNKCEKFLGRPFFNDMVCLHLVLTFFNKNISNSLSVNARNDKHWVRPPLIRRKDIQKFFEYPFFGFGSSHIFDSLFR